MVPDLLLEINLPAGLAVLCYAMCVRFDNDTTSTYIAQVCCCDPILVDDISNEITDGMHGLHVFILKLLLLEYYWHR
jgi:hypothetical protein